MPRARTNLHRETAELLSNLEQREPGSFLATIRRYLRPDETRIMANAPYKDSSRGPRAADRSCPLGLTRVLPGRLVVAADEFSYAIAARFGYRNQPTEARQAREEAEREASDFIMAWDFGIIGPEHLPAVLGMGGAKWTERT